MKKRWAWRYTLKHRFDPDSPLVSQWYGNCPLWASSAPDHAVVTRERVLTLGVKPEPCNVPECGQKHVPVPCPY